MSSNKGLICHEKIPLSFPLLPLYNVHTYFLLSSCSLLSPLLLLSSHSLLSLAIPAILAFQLLHAIPAAPTFQLLIAIPVTPIFQEVINCHPFPSWFPEFSSYPPSLSCCFPFLLFLSPLFQLFCSSFLPKSFLFL